MKIFLTGATGFLGSHVLRAALMEGHAVVAWRRPQSSSGDSPVETVGSKGRLQWIERDLSGLEPHHLEGCDVLLHLAAAGVSPQSVTWDEALTFNVRGALAVAELSLRGGVPRLLCAGSVVEYGRAADRYQSIPPDAPLEPVGPYAASKAAASVSLAGWARETGARLAILRASNLYGEGQHPSNFWMQLRAAAASGRDFQMSPGAQVRDFMPVETAAKEMLRACTALPLSGGHPGIVHIASGRAASLAEFAASEWTRLGATGRLLVGALPYRSMEIMRCVPAPTPWSTDSTLSSIPCAT